MRRVPVTKLFPLSERHEQSQSFRREPPIPLTPRASDPERPTPRPLPVFVRESHSAGFAGERPAVHRPVFARPEERPAQARPAAPQQSRTIDAIIDDAFERGREAGRREEQEAQQEREAADRIARREQTIIERVEFQLHEYAKLAGAIAEALAETEGRIAATIARLLTPVFEERFVQEAIAELASAMKLLASNRSPELIRIRGPERLLGRLADALEPFAVGVEYILEDRIDVQVQADETILETQLSRWADSLHSAMKD